MSDPEAPHSRDTHAPERAGGSATGPVSPRWAPDALRAGIDFENANAARMYDYMLGGAHNFAVDRDHAQRIIEGNPNAVWVARANRSFLRRAVNWCLSQGIDQFLDLGSGVPTVGNVHEVAHHFDPHARVAYVDYEPVAVAHATEIVADLPTVTATRADVRDPDAVLTAPGVAGLLDFTRPVALLAVAVLHFVPDDLTPVISRYRHTLHPGSALVISHISDDTDDPDLAARTRGGEQAQRSSANPLTFRDSRQLRDLFDGLEDEPPGIVDVVDWPDADPAATRTGIYAAVARKATG